MSAVPASRAQADRRYCTGAPLAAYDRLSARVDQFSEPLFFCTPSRVALGTCGYRTAGTGHGERTAGATYDHLLESAQLVEQYGYAGLFLSDHYTAFAGDGLPGPTDVWTPLAGLARETSRIRMGSLLTPVTFRHPGPLAVTVAQVDAMSSGRTEFGFGAGYVEAEHVGYGIPFPSARKRFERLAKRWS